MKSNPGLVPYMCRGELQIEPFSTRAVNENKIPSLWVQLHHILGSRNLSRKKDGTDRSSQPHLQLGSSSSPSQSLEDMGAMSNVHVGSGSRPPQRNELPLLWNAEGAQPLQEFTDPPWPVRPGPHRFRALCLLPEAKGKLLVHLPDLLAPMDRTHSCNTLCSSTAEAGSWKEKLIVSYVPLKFLLPLSCNSFSLLSAF